MCVAVHERLAEVWVQLRRNEMRVGLPGTERAGDRYAVVKVGCHDGPVQKPDDHAAGSHTP